MKKIRLLYAIGCLLISANIVWAQKSDDVNTNEEIQLIEGILDQLFYGQNNGQVRNAVNGNYIPGYGMIFKVPRGNRVFSVDNNAVIISRGTGTNGFAVSRNYRNVVDTDSLHESELASFQQTISRFFTNYGDLLSAYKPGEKIIVIYNSGFGHDQSYWVSGIQINDNVKKLQLPQKLIAKVEFNDIDQYKNRKMSEEQFLKTINITEHQEESEDNQEYDILASIFQKLIFRENENFGFGDHVKYERIDGLGVIYEINMHGISVSRDVLVVPDVQEPVLYHIDGEDSSSERSNKQIQEQYVSNLNRYKEEVEKEYLDQKLKFKQYLVKYGKTLTALGEDDILMMIVEMNHCFSCKRPKKLNLIVDAKTLKDYDQRKLTLEQAIDRVLEEEFQR